MDHPFRSWCGVAPLVMSCAVLALMFLDDLYALDPMPIHDEGLLDHIAMLLLIGQLPVIAALLVIHRHQKWRLLPVLVAQLALIGLVYVCGNLLAQHAKQQVARRIAAHQPLVGSEAALRRFLTGAEPAAALSAQLRRALDRDPALAVPASLGPLQSLSFLGVDDIGWDRYAALYQNGAREWRLFLADDSIIYGLTMIDDACRSSEPYECRSIAANGRNRQ